MEREQWSSRPAFIVAAIGSAVGFGNVWRFPNLAYDYGGGAFFIPYVLALLLIGLPLLILETAIGQFYQTGDAGAFGMMHRRFRGLGLASIFLGFVVLLYYPALLAWVCRMFIISIQGSEGRWAGVSGDKAFEWFVNDVTGLSTAGAGLVPTRLVGGNVAALAFTWATIFLCLAFGVKVTGRIAFVTVGLPIVMLLVLLVRAATLTGAGDGVRAYIGRWDTSVLSERPAVWTEAVSQIFFSLSVAFGVMTAYGSYNRRDWPVTTNAVVIALSNSFFSFVAGFAVFGTLGHLAARDNVSVNEVASVAGPALMFGTYPVALSTLPGGGHWERLLFVTLFLLGIDSAFSIAEGVATVIQDSALFRRVGRLAVKALVCSVGFVAGLLYCTDTGLIFLDVTDFYVNFTLLLIGFFECFAVGWMYGIGEQMRRVGQAPVVALCATSFGSVTLASGLWFGLAKREDLEPTSWTSRNASLLWGFVALILSNLVGLGATFFLARRQRRSGGHAATLSIIDYISELLMGNVLRLRSNLVGVVHYIPLVWFVLIRHVIPQVLLVLFANLAASETKDGHPRFGNYEGYNRGYQTLGIVVVAVAALIIGVGILVPEVFACFGTAAIDEDKVTSDGENAMSDVPSSYVGPTAPKATTDATVPV